MFNLGIVGQPDVTVSACILEEDVEAADAADITPNMEVSWKRFMFNRIRHRLSEETPGVRYFPV